MKAPEASSQRAPLAIVIPAYKADFFAATLASIARQTCRDFVVYVGDDAAPYDLAVICRDFEQHLPLRYTRFARNLGQRDLVGHWERCIALSSEPWVWLFSDDDLMDPDCVAVWRTRVIEDAGAFDLYHFDVVEIDARGAVSGEAPPFPDCLPTLQFMLARMENRLSSYAPDYIFSRAALRAQGGFQSFPAAWAADDATWIKLGRRGGIRAVRGPKVRWRRSTLNISAPHSPQARQKLAGAVQFVGWAARYLRQHPPGVDDPSAEVLMERAWHWLHEQRVWLDVPFSRGGLTHAWHLRSADRYGFLGAALRLAYWELRWRFRGW